jgi:Na+/H+-dicarboxylate symporter
VEGKAVNPLRLGSDIGEVSLDNTYGILSQLNMAPHYSYSDGANILSCELHPPRKLNMMHRIALAVVAAVLTLLVVNVFLPAYAMPLEKSIVHPVFGKIVHIFGALATPLVFFAVVTGMINIGNVSALEKIGQNFLKTMMSTYLFTSIIAAVTGYFIFGLNAGKMTEGSGLDAIVKLILDIVPDNLVQPFVQDNDLQVIVIAMFTGLVLILLPEKTLVLKKVIADLAELVNRMMTVVCHLLPFLVYIGVLDIVLSGHLAQIGKVYMTALAVAITTVATLLYTILRVKFRTGYPLKQVFQAQLPSLSINLATSSQVAAYGESLICCKEKFRLEDKLVDFAMPLGMVMYMPCGSAMLSFITWWIMCTVAGMPMPIEAVIKLLVLGVILAIAAPPIPGSGILMIPILFSSMGIGQDYISIAIILVTVLGYFMPAANGYCLQLELLLLGKKLDMIKPSDKT